jgi:hypothetical protein
VSQSHNHVEGVTVIGSPERRDDPGDQDDPDGQVPVGQRNADGPELWDVGDGHGRRGGFPRRWVPSDTIVKYAIIVTALIGALGLVFQLAR